MSILSVVVKNKGLTYNIDFIVFATAFCSVIVLTAVAIPIAASEEDSIDGEALMFHWGFVAILATITTYLNAASITRFPATFFPAFFATALMVRPALYYIKQASLKTLSLACGAQFLVTATILWIIKMT